MTVALLEGGRTARRDAGWEGAGLLGGRVVADCWAGESTTPIGGVVTFSWYSSLQ